MLSLSPADQPLSKWTVALALLSSAMLLAMICYPFGYDQAVFSVGAEMILKKYALPWRDFLDTKPPLIFYIYSVALAIFGHHEWSPRAFDILYQFAAAYYFYRILRREFDANFSLIAVSLTMLLYAGSGFWMTAQAESFALIPSLLIIDATLRYAKRQSAFAMGLLAGFACDFLLFLKLTLVLGMAGALLFVIVDKTNPLKRKIGFLAGAIVSFGGIVALIAYVLDHEHALSSFMLAIQWLSGYSSLRDSVLLFPERLIYSTSITLLIAGAWGVWRYLQTEEHSPTLARLFVTFLAHLVGILIEGKIVFPYQYTRALWAFTPFMVIGIYDTSDTLRVKLGALPRQTANTLLALALLLATIFSPLPRLYTQSISWLFIQLRGADAHAEVHRRIQDYFADEQVATGNYLKSKLSNGDKLFFWGNDVGVHFYAGQIPPTICLTATPLRTSWTPLVWKDTMIAQLKIARPKYFVSEFDDAKEYITGSPIDSYKALLIWPELHRYLYNNYLPDTTIGHFEIFRRKR